VQTSGGTSHGKYPPIAAPVARMHLTKLPGALPMPHTLPPQPARNQGGDGCIIMRRRDNNLIHPLGSFLSVLFAAPPMQHQVPNHPLRMDGAGGFHKSWCRPRGALGRRGQPSALPIRLLPFGPGQPHGLPPARGTERCAQCMSGHRRSSPRHADQTACRAQQLSSLRALTNTASLNQATCKAGVVQGWSWMMGWSSGWCVMDGAGIV